MTEQMQLPPLPAPCHHGGTYESSPFTYYTAEQMREYALAVRSTTFERDRLAVLDEAIQAVSAVVYDPNVALVKEGPEALKALRNLRAIVRAVAEIGAKA